VTISINNDWQVFDNLIPALYTSLAGDSYVLNILQAPATDNVSGEQEVVLNTSDVAKFVIFVSELPVPLESNTRLVTLNRSFRIIEFIKESLYSRYVVHAVIDAGQNLP